MKQTATRSEIESALEYRPDIGEFAWRNDTSRTKRGQIAGGYDVFGYRRVRIAGRSFLAHRVIWFLETGAWPVAMIDHIDGNPANNRFSNLREATSAQNQRNRGARRDSRSGLRGVHLMKNGKWAAQIQIGSFDTADEARAAFLRVAEFTFGEFAPTARPNESLLKARALRGLRVPEKEG